MDQGQKGDTRKNGQINLWILDTYQTFIYQRHISGYVWKHLLLAARGVYILASCPWGPVTANGVELLTEIYVYIWRPKFRPLGPLASAGERVTDGRKESQEIYIDDLEKVTLLGTVQFGINRLFYNLGEVGSCYIKSDIIRKMPVVFPGFWIAITLNLTTVFWGLFRPRWA